MRYGVARLYPRQVDLRAYDLTELDVYVLKQI